ncbi:recombinase RecT [Apilactobacillus xinyiensis]|uniref:recombinase RecT n=1 Tax=Apilactobacillus xinyiensis TaxID=2841032 RepID=UPI0024B03F94|nr:RecT family recombinase [Apilactobacillus xinyiensis]
MTELVQSVVNQIDSLKEKQGLQLPQGYSVSNALQSAWLELTDTTNGMPLVKKCSTQSIAKALFNMAIQGLSSAKNQCYFIPYGKELVLQRSYFGTISVINRLSNVKKIKAQVVFEGDEFEIGSDDDFNTVVKKFIPKFENRDKAIVGAFAFIEKEDGSRDYTIMTKKEIDTSWNQAKAKNSGARRNFSQEMAKRTVINRAAKFYINSSNDNDLFVQAINDTTEKEYDDSRKDVTPENKNTIDSMISSKKESNEVKPEEGQEPKKDLEKVAPENNHDEEIEIKDTSIDEDMEELTQDSENSAANEPNQSNNSEEMSEDDSNSSEGQQEDLFSNINDLPTK